MSNQLIVYGAYGFTGRLVAQEAVARGLRPRLAGRDAVKPRAVAESLGCEHTAVGIDDAAGLRALLQPASVVLHCAGPFVDTSAPMVQACLDTGTHYVDITGEPPVFAACHDRDAEARTKGVMLLPGAGFDVVPTDCLSGLLKQRLPDATHLTLAFMSSGGLSRGTMRTGSRYLADGTLVRVDGRVVTRAGSPCIRVDLGDGPTEVTATTWGDVYTAWYSTGIPNIEVFMAMPPEGRKMVDSPLLVRKFLASRLARGLVERKLQAMPAGPSDEARATGHALAYGRATNAAGQSVELRLRTHEAYRLTAESAVEIGKRVLNGDAPVGYQSPAMAYGPELVLALEGSELIEA
ncbi:MAG: saccharopine dehydrogenase NADP-binding domain-containing protein [Burkholderiaceae bacterium]